MDNFNTKKNLGLSKVKRSWRLFLQRRRGFVYGGVLGLLLLFAFVSLPTLSRWFSLLLASPQALEAREGRTNLLILGAGGAGHEAADLTDTIIFISLDHQDRRPVLLSLPRDIWITSMRAKINTAYYYGNQKREGGGIILAKSSVSEILDQPVHYAAVIDFAGFVKTLDLLGGVEVEVERSFDDYKYPIPGKENDDCGGDPEFSCRYEHIHFEEGPQVMDGATALKFVRSRNAEGEEGTDFARSARQQKVVLALKKKLSSPTILLSPGKILALWQIFNDSVETDVPKSKWPALGRLLFSLNQERIRSEVLNGGLPDQEGFLENPPISSRFDNQWVLVPADGTWDEAQEWIDCLILGGECKVEDFISK